MNARHVTLALAVASSLVSLPASALVTRAFVSGGGSDANTAVNCSLTQPCRTFQNAMTVLTDGGEVIALDSAGYGTVNITKSVSLIAPTGIFAGLTPTTAGSAGVTIATAGVKVNLRGITINNQGGQYGINMTNGAALDLNNVVIGGFVGTAHYALNVQTPAVVTAKNVSILNAGLGMIFGNGATASVSDSNLQGIQYDGIKIAGGGSGVTTVVASDTSVTSSSFDGSYCFHNNASTGTTGRMFLTRVTATNCYFGIAHQPAAENSMNQTSVGFSVIGGTAELLMSHMDSCGLCNFPDSGSYGLFLSQGNNRVGGYINDTYGTITAGGVH